MGNCETENLPVNQASSRQLQTVADNRKEPIDHVIAKTDRKKIRGKLCRISIIGIWDKIQYPNEFERWKEENAD